MNTKQAHALILEYYTRFHDPKYLEWDPLLIARQYLGTKDAELIALMSALFAFGGVKQIIKSLSNAIEKLEIAAHRKNNQSLLQVIQEFENEHELGIFLEEKLKGFRHRVYVDRDLVMIILLYRRSCMEHGSLKDHFLHHHDPSSETVEEGLVGLIADYRAWSKEIVYHPGRFFNHMLNSPEQKSACKRWLMFLKWMVRADDGIDLGLWASAGARKKIRTDQLLIPMDTHLFKISKRLKLTRKKTANWASSIEVTRNLKKLDAADPTKFDFALCRFGMLDYRKLLNPHPIQEWK